MKTQTPREPIESNLKKLIQSNIIQLLEIRDHEPVPIKPG
jgi:hypothetical protein